MTILCAVRSGMLLEKQKPTVIRWGTETGIMPTGGLPKTRRAGGTRHILPVPLLPVLISLGRQQRLSPFRHIIFQRMRDPGSIWNVRKNFLPMRNPIPRPPVLAAKQGVFIPAAAGKTIWHWRLHGCTVRREMRLISQRQRHMFRILVLLIAGMI